MSDIKNTLENLIESTYKVEQEYRVLSASYENMRKFLRQIVESLGAALWVVDASGKVVLENSLASSLSDVFASIKALGKSGEIELVFFPNVLEKVSYMLNPDSAIAVAGRISAKEDSAPKIIVSDAVLLRTAFNGYATPLLESPEAEPVQKTRRAESVSPAAPAEAREPLPKKLYLRVPDMTGAVFDRVSALLDIFAGRCEIIFYDMSQGKYIKAVGAGTSPEKNMMKLLRIQIRRLLSPSRVANQSH